MPGLIAVVDTRDHKGLVDLSVRMCRSMKHEHWYTTDLWHGEGVALGRVSLGTVDPEHQPFFSEDGSLCIVMEGDIFDTKQLRNDLLSRGHSLRTNNNPELLLRAYEEYGDGFANRLNGIFVLTIWDSKRKRLIVANDRYGVRFLYYAQNNGRALFASEVKAILEVTPTESFIFVLNP